MHTMRSCGTSRTARPDVLCSPCEATDTCCVEGEAIDSLAATFDFDVNDPVQGEGCELAQAGMRGTSITRSMQSARDVSIQMTVAVSIKATNGAVDGQ